MNYSDISSKNNLNESNYIEKTEDTLNTVDEISIKKRDFVLNEIKPGVNVVINKVQERDIDNDKDDLYNKNGLIEIKEQNKDEYNFEEDSINELNNDSINDIRNSSINKEIENINESLLSNKDINI